MVPLEGGESTPPEDEFPELDIEPEEAQRLPQISLTSKIWERLFPSREFDPNQTFAAKLSLREVPPGQNFTGKPTKGKKEVFATLYDPRTGEYIAGRVHIPGYLLDTATLEQLEGPN